MDRLAKADAIVAVDDLLTRLNSTRPKEADEDAPNSSSIYEYTRAYFGMEVLLQELFTSRVALKFRWSMYGTDATSKLLDTVPVPKSNFELMALIRKAAIHGEVYRRRLAFWPDKWSTSPAYVSKADATAVVDELLSHLKNASPYGREESVPDPFDVEEYLRGYFGIESLGDEFFADTDSDQASRYQPSAVIQTPTFDSRTDPTTNTELRSLVRQGMLRANIYRERIQSWPQSGFDIAPRYRDQAVEPNAIKYPSRGMVVYPIPLFPRIDVEMDKSLCFVIMPFAAQFDLVYASGIKPAVEGCGLICMRGDDIQQPGTIMRQIWDSLVRSYLIIADLTGSNGNVLYELGLAHVIGHEAILLTQNIENVPFDLRQQRHIVYSTSHLQKLRSDVETAVYAALAAKHHE